MRLIISLCWLIAFNVTGANQFTLYFSRHAEKLPAVNHDPALSKKGQQRAANLATFLADKHIQAIYSTDYKRTEQTAKPVAKQAGLPIIVYDHNHLSALASMLREQKQNAFIVGHSNTTPLMVHLMGGQAESIDESRYGDVFAVRFDEQGNAETKSITIPPQPDMMVTALPALPDKLQAGKRKYRIISDGQEVGYAIKDIRVKSKQVEITSIVLIEKQNINTIVKTWVNRNDFKPLQMRMSGSMSKPVDIQLSFVDNHVMGHSDMAREPFQEQGKLMVDTWLPANSYERVSVLSLVQALDYSEQPLYFRWFNGQNEEIKVISMQKTAETRIDVPAGSYEVDRVELTGGAPSQIFYISQEAHEVIKVEIPAIGWVIEKVE